MVWNEEEEFEVVSDNMIGDIKKDEIINPNDPVSEMCSNFENGECTSMDLDIKKCKGGYNGCCIQRALEEGKMCNTNKYFLIKE